MKVGITYIYIYLFIPVEFWKYEVNIRILNLSKLYAIIRILFKSNM